MVALDESKLGFIAIASHELRTPTTAIYGILATLRDRGPALPADVRSRLETTAFEQADRMRRLIEQLLDLSRLDLRSVTIEPRPLVLRQLLEEVIQAAAPDAVELDVDPALPSSRRRRCSTACSRI